MLSLIRRAGPFAGLTAAIVPFAILVHLVAEALALGLTTIDAAFVVRHVYLAVIMLATLAWYARTAGLGAAPAERLRRSALVRACAVRWGPAGFAALAGANLIVFTLGQAVEGAPIAAGSLALGIAAGLVGSLLSALGILAVGRPVARAVARAIGSRSPHPPRAIPVADRGLALIATPLRALVSRCLPNRAPPSPLPV
jgi:hypothetical protein